MKYTFVSLGKLEGICVRLNGVDIGFILFLWASFLGKIKIIWFAVQMRKKQPLENSRFEGEFDYNDNLSISIIKLLKND